MTPASAVYPIPESIDLKTQISELENQYAELFLAHDNREELKKIHQRLETLKQELEHKTRKRRQIRPADPTLAGSH